MTRPSPRHLVLPAPATSGAGVGGPNGTTEDTITSTKAPETEHPPKGDGPGSGNSKTVTRPGDRIFSSLASGSAIFITVVIAAIGAFLIWRAVPALSRNQVNFLTSREWVTQNINAMAFGVLDLFQVTVLVSLFALVLAMPIALGIAIFLTSYSPKWLTRPLSYTIDLLAAVPSIVYGLWGTSRLRSGDHPGRGVAQTTLSAGSRSSPTAAESITGGGTIFTAGIVLAVMILPVITAVTREVFIQTPAITDRSRTRPRRHALGSCAHHGHPVR